MYQSIQFKVLPYIVNCAFCYYLCYSEISGLEYTMHACILKPAFSEEHEGIFRDVAFCIWRRNTNMKQNIHLKNFFHCGICMKRNVVSRYSAIVRAWCRNVDGRTTACARTFW